MPRASRKKFDKDTSKELKDNFAFLISSLSNSIEIEDFFHDFLTSEEKIMLFKRLMLHLMLESGYKPSEIKKVLGISGETIRVHNNIWSKGGETYKKIIRRMAKRGKAKKFWRGIEKILKPINLALNAKRNMKARAKLASGDWFDG